MIEAHVEESPRRDWEWRYVSHAFEKLAIAFVWTGERSHFTLKPFSQVSPKP
jgi:hypothetical protein